MVCTTACGRLSFDPIGAAGGDGGVVTAANIPSWTSGTRMRAETGRLVSYGLVGLDGARVRRGWRDTMRGDMRGPLLPPVDATAAAPTQRFNYAFSCQSAAFDGSVSYVVGGAPISIDSFAFGTDRVE